MIGQLFDTMIIASKSGSDDPSKFKSWKMLETVLSYFKKELSFHRHSRQTRSVPFETLPREGISHLM